MTWRIEELTNRNIVSFGDAHSPQKLGREATVFELSEVSYENVRKAIEGEKWVVRSEHSSGDEDEFLKKHNTHPTSRRTTQSHPHISYTIEFYPEEGKYHYTGHRKCGVVYSPNETRKMGVTCPVCGKELTLGVMSRVETLASNDIETESKTDEFGVRWIKPASLRAVGSTSRRPYVMLVPLIEIIAEVLGVGVGTQQVSKVYEQLINSFGNEFNVLLTTPEVEIQKVVDPKIVEGIKKVRSGDIVIDPGYDGVFGKIKIWSSSTKTLEDKKEIDQETLF
jgi:PHP family Zn ribbon phosphoesterase